MRIETRTTMVPNSEKIYIADDGTEFMSHSECINYELDVYRKWIEQSNDVIECKELLDCPPFDGGEYSSENTYRWFKPINEKGIELLNKAFPAYSYIGELHSNDIGEWCCAEYDPYDHLYYWNALSESQAYANKVLSFLNAIDMEENNND